MRPLRLLILLLVLTSALFVALVRPLPDAASGAAVATKKLARKHTHKHQIRRRHHHAANRRPLGVRAANYAKRFRGVPYAWGGSSPRTGFDCSGFVRYVYQHFGIALPHSSYGDMSHGRRVLRKYLKPGDLLFFADGGHVGIYVGHHKLIDALHTGTVIRISTMRDWYSYDYYTARRLPHTA
jgi:cell wall-associated NlpC family hydrolase